MNLGKYLTILGVCTSLCWSALFAVVFLFDPVLAGWPAFLFFYLSLIFSLIGTFSLIGYLLRSWFTRASDIPPAKQIRIATRQSLWLSLVAVMALILQSQRLLTWWNLSILVALAVAMEMFFISHKKINN